MELSVCLYGPAHILVSFYHITQSFIRGYLINCCYPLGVEAVRCIYLSAIILRAINNDSFRKIVVYLGQISSSMVPRRQISRVKCSAIETKELSKLATFFQ